MLNVSVLGFGGRGSIYAQNFHKCGIRIAAVCDPDLNRRKLATEYTDCLFEDEETFFLAGKLSDLLVIATMDRLHYPQVMRALELGYDVLLEKPIALSAQECKNIEQKAKEIHAKVIVCHVLRYTPFFTAIKNTLDSGRLGDVVTIRLTENVGYYHFAHSYVRGNWRNKATSSPVILAKSSHDLDIINWLADSQCTDISSFGSLHLFRPEKAPEGSAARCRDCGCRDSCVFDCYRIYTNPEYERIAALARHGHLGNTVEDITAKLSSDGEVLGRCVYHCDNDVFDNQIVNMSFANGVHAQFMLTAFTEDLNREIQICCEKGEIVGSIDDKRFRIIPFAGKPEVVDLVQDEELYSSHGGGDMGIVQSVIRSYLHNDACASEISQSVASHLMCFAADQSANDNGRVIHIHY